MRIFFVLALVFVFFGAASQNHIRKNIYQGKEYLVYPLRYDFNPQTEIPPYFGKLPDGDYIMYGAYQYKRKRFSRKAILDDTTSVSAIFSLKEGKPEGNIEWYDRSGTLAGSGSFKNGLKEGEWKYTFFNWEEITFSITSNYKDGVLHGPYVSRQGEMTHSCYYEKGKMHGLSEKSIEGFVYEKSFYSNGSLAGVSVEYDPETKAKIREMNYADGNLNGSFKVWYPNGKLKEEGDCFNGTKNYNSSFYAQLLTCEGSGAQYVNSDIGYINTGWVKKYNENGKKMLDIRYLNGQIAWTDTMWFDNGNPRVIIVKKNPELPDSLASFSSRIYNESGSIFCEQKFKKGKLVYKYYLDWNGDSKYTSITEEYFNYDSLSGYAPILISVEKAQNMRKERYFIPDADIYLEKNFENGNLDFDFAVIPDEDPAQPPVIAFIENYNSADPGIHSFQKYTYQRIGPYSKLKTDSVRYFSNGKLFSGDVVIRFSEHEAERGQVFFKAGKLNIINRDWIQEGTGISLEGWIQQGKPEGKWIQIRKDETDQKVIYTLKNDKLEGEYQMYEKNRSTSQYRLTDRYFYIDGILNGPCMSYLANGILRDSCIYQNGVRHGVSKHWDNSGNIEQIIHYSEGIIDGIYEVYEHGNLIEKANFSKHVLQDNYTRYTPDGKVWLEVKVKNKIPVEWSYYHAQGWLAARMIFDPADSVMFYRTNKNFWSGEEFPFKMNQGFDLITGIYFAYYKNGTLLCKGPVWNNKRKGKWEYYDISGNRLYEIDYDHEFENKQMITSWYSNGKLQGTGCLASFMEEYSCRINEIQPFAEIEFFNYFNTEGEQTLKNGTGTIKITNAYGLVVSEGNYIDSLKNGIWKTWDPDGKLKEIGTYIKGIKEGKWYSGDLEGVNFADEACFDMSDPHISRMIDMSKKELEIHVYFYKGGKIIDHQKYYVDMNKDKNLRIMNIPGN